MADTKEISKINLDNILYDIKDNAAREAVNKKLDTTTTETQTVAGNINFNNTVKAKELFENDKRVITGATSEIIFTTEGEKPDFSIEEDEENGQMYFKFQLPEGLETVAGTISEIQTSLSNKAPKEHSFTYEMLENNNHYGLGTDSVYGHIKLSDDYDFDDGDAAAGIGASQFALFNAYTELINKPKVTYLIEATGNPLSGTLTTINEESFLNYDLLVIQARWSWSEGSLHTGMVPAITVATSEKFTQGVTIYSTFATSTTTPVLRLLETPLKYIDEKTCSLEVIIPGGKPDSLYPTFLSIIGIKL